MGKPPPRSSRAAPTPPVTAEIARTHAESEFEKYRITQDRLFESDFDRVVAETKRLAEGNASATLRVIVKRILRKYGYPPDKQEAATNTVLQQAELLSIAQRARRARPNLARVFE